MSSDDWGTYRHDIDVHIVDGAYYLQHRVRCNPADWTETRARISASEDMPALYRPESWSELRDPDCLRADSVLVPTTAQRANAELLGRGNPLRAGTDDDRPV